MENLSPYAPPKSDLSISPENIFRRDGRYVVFNRNMPWPKRCYKCNQHAADTRLSRLPYRNKWFAANFLLNGLFAFFSGSVLTNQFEVQLPICNTHLRARRKMILLRLLSPFLFLAVLVLGVVFSNPYILGCAGVLLILNLLFAALAREISTAKFKDGLIWVSGTGREFRESLKPLED